MNVARRAFINRLYNLFHDVYKVLGDQQVAFDEVTEGQPRSVKVALASELRVKGYVDIVA